MCTPPDENNFFAERAFDAAYGTQEIGVGWTISTITFGRVKYGYHGSMR